MYSMEYGRRFSTTFPFDYKSTLWLIPFCLIILFCLVIVFDESFIMALGFPAIIIVFMLGTMGDQLNDEAFENGLKIAVGGRAFRAFIPYEDVVLICSYRFFRDIYNLPNFSEGLLLILKKPKSDKLQTYLMRDCRATPFVAVLPQMRTRHPYWIHIYHPEILFLDASNVTSLQFELARNSYALHYLINKYRSF